jgi:hypothetical protein
MHQTQEDALTFIELSEVLGNLGEFVGSFAVVSTLIYLTIQVRHSRDAMQENARLAQGAVLASTLTHVSHGIPQARIFVADNAIQTS